MIKLTFLKISLVVGVILLVSFSLTNRGDMAVLSIFGVFILISIGILMEKERKKKHQN
ncbi:hypothetical protein [Jeotgalicoccus psychrophilus]|uniref:hypothetical protein n=1 Tax=Jeotgalicoccus psychrophilus TaxID=157228 RepID=UPI000418EDD2|nr:hypothetical protein [Jeotgalicoccus psychrophilus]